MPFKTTLSHKDRTDPLIQFTHVHKSYVKDRRVFRDVSLEVVRGDFVFLSGPSGTGKSTFLKLMLGSESPDRGHVLFEGRSLERMLPKEMAYFRRRTGVVFQDLKLIGHRTVYENVALPLEIAGRDSAFIQRKVLRVLRMIGLDLNGRSECARLSASEQQLVAVARAVVNDPVLLMLDEPTGRLNKDTLFRIAELLRLIHARGSTVVIASHDESLREAIPHTRVLTIVGGKISEM